jgi:hypothetical protein
MKIFLDTEFTDFVNSELISIGIVDENGREFYAELTDFRREACSEFVVETVLPLLGQYPASIVGTKQHIAYRLSQWLEEYRDWEDGATICVDYGTDWDLFVDLLHESPVMEFITAELIWKDLDLPKIEWWWTETGLPRHMALYDARANRYGYNQKNV